jgi:GMP synthase-like glutamine amidotransferase
VVSRNSVKEIGWGEVQVSANDIARGWFGEIQNFEAFHWHGETFTLPQGATHLLSSQYCANQAYAIGKHLALQCHVEMTAEMIAVWCATGADEVAAASNSPAVQSINAIQKQMTGKLPRLKLVADQLYTKWCGGL